MQTGKKINQISNRLRRRSRVIQETIGISGAQGNILNYILVESQNRSVYQKDIEQEFGLRPSMATEALKSLKKNELMGSMKVSNVIAKMAIPSVISSPVKYGDALPATILSVLRQGLLLIPLLYLLNTVFGLNGVIYGQALTDCVAIVLSMCIWGRKKKKLKSE